MADEKWKYLHVERFRQQGSWRLNPPDPELEREINSTEKKIGEALNLLGDAGWELVAVTEVARARDTYDTCFYLKRPAG